MRSPFAGESRISWALRRFWRARIRPLWREARAPIVLSLGLSVIVLGTIGFAEEGKDWWEALFKSFQLYGFAGGDLDDDSPVVLNIARVLGPLIVGVAAIKGLLVLSREQLRLIGFRLFRRGHIVIVGLGDVGFRLAAHLNELGARVIAIDRDATKPSIEGCRERGISALVGDATDPDLLGAACVHRAKHLIVAPGTDSVAIDVLAAATSIAVGRELDPLQAIAHIEDRALWHALQAHTLTHGHDPSVHVELFNLYEAAGRRVLAADPPFTPEAARERRGPRVLIVADQAIAEVLVVNVARLWRNQRAHERARIEIDLVGPASEADAARIRERYPAIDGIARLEPWEVDLGSPVLRESSQNEGAGAVYVALGDEAKGVATALTLAATRSSDRQVALIVNDKRLGSSSLAGEGDRRAPIRVFGIVDLVLDRHFLESGLNEALAQAIHDAYYRKELAKGGALGAKARPWEELDEDGRAANRAAAADIPGKLRKIGCVVVPAALVDLERSRRIFERRLGPELEPFARQEHDRWMRERIRQGWTYAPTRNDALKQHDLLVPYDDLSEADRQKDRDNILELPKTLRESGFAIEEAASP